jgi:hypothetical protein
MFAAHDPTIDGGGRWHVTAALLFGIGAVTRLAGTTTSWIV